MPENLFLHKYTLLIGNNWTYFSTHVSWRMTFSWDCYNKKNYSVCHHNLRTVIFSMTERVIAMFPVELAMEFHHEPWEKTNMIMLWKSRGGGSASHHCPIAAWAKCLFSNSPHLPLLSFTFATVHFRYQLSFTPTCALPQKRCTWWSCNVNMSRWVYKHPGRHSTYRWGYSSSVDQHYISLMLTLS